MHTSTEEYRLWGTKPARLAARFSAREHEVIQQVLAHLSPMPLSVWARSEFVAAWVRCEQDPAVAPVLGTQVRAFKANVRKLGPTVEVLHLRVPRLYMEWFDQFQRQHVDGVSPGLYLRWLLHESAPKRLAQPSTTAREAAYADYWRQVHEPASRPPVPVVTPA